MRIYRQWTGESEELTAECADYLGDYDCQMELGAVDTLTWVALTLPLIALWVVAFWDIVRRPDLGPIRKLGWAVAIVLTAYIGIAVYAMMRPIPQPPGKVTNATLPRASAIVGSLESLVAAHASGTVSDDSFDREKRSILGLG
jgi:Phospholipase_D-nuclease N-terminal